MKNAPFQDDPNSDNLGLSFTEGAAASSFAFKKRDIDIGVDKKLEYDFQGEVARMLEVANQQREEIGGGIRISEMDFVDEFLDADSLVDPLEKLLREAQDHIREGRYDNAIAVLNAIVGEYPGHHEAIYLTAYSYAHRDEGEAAAALALKILCPLRYLPLECSLSVRVETLCDSLRSRHQVSFRRDFEAYKKDPATLIPFLHQEIELDPIASLPHYLLAGELMTNDRLDEAIAAADYGLQTIREEEREPLNRVREAICDRMVKQALQLALQFYRQGNFVQAYAALVQLPDIHRQSRLCCTFEAYLTALGGDDGTNCSNGLVSEAIQRSPKDVRPFGTESDVKELGFFIVRADLDFIQEEMGTKNRSLAGVRDAERRALEATRHAPWFPHIHFICGQCVYARLVEALEAGYPPTLEGVEADLQRARSHLAIAITDSELTGAPDALRTVDGLLTELEKVKKSTGETFGNGESTYRPIG